MSEQEIQKIIKIHFVGIGGIGMSALARMFLNMGKVVSGSDAHESDLTKKLEQEGIKIFYSHDANNINDDVDCVVYTLAVTNDNPEIVRANELGVPKFYYAEMLGMVSKDFYTIAVSGTHGKTTTTAMLAKVFETADKKPNVIVGSIMAEKGSNYIKGDSKYFIVEACEYKRSFLNLSPKVLIITNLEEDHLDYYRDLSDIQNAFHDLVMKVPADGLIVCDTDDEKVKPATDGAVAKVLDYKKFISKVPELFVPGEYNVRNAASVYAVCEELKINGVAIVNGLKNFKGTWRRSEFIRETENGNLIYDDYAHHPSEIKTTLQGFKTKFPDRKIVLIFEPHLYSRTKEHFVDFVSALGIADKVMLMPIFAAREQFDESINSKMIADKISGAISFENTNEVLEKINEIDAQEKNILFISMGAGSIYKIW